MDRRAKLACRLAGANAQDASSFASKMNGFFARLGRLFLWTRLVPHMIEASFHLISAAAQQPTRV